MTFRAKDLKPLRTSPPFYLNISHNLYTFVNLGCVFLKDGYNLNYNTIDIRNKQRFGTLSNKNLKYSNIFIMSLQYLEQKNPSQNYWLGLGGELEN